MTEPATDRCPGAVIVHSGFGSECTEPDCDGLELAHDYRLDCAAVGCRCGDSAALAV